MTIDEAIKQIEEVAEEQAKLCKRYDDASGYSRSHNETIRTDNAKKCEKCAKEHRQLAEWLKDYKRLLEQQPCEDAVSRQAVHDGMIKYGFHSSDMTITEFVEDVLPPVTPTSKKGKWIIDDEELGIIWHCHCSKCKKAPQDYIGGTENWWLVRLPDYCPNCGIEMESEEE